MGFESITTVRIEALNHIPTLTAVSECRVPLNAYVT